MIARGQVLRWLLRYAPSEVIGAATALVVLLAVDRATGNAAAAGYAGAISEGLAFYGLLFVRELARRRRSDARTLRTVWLDSVNVVREMAFEFGLAEVLDLLFVRPFCLASGLRLLGGSPGVLAGKLIADLVFYGQVVTVHEWRNGRSSPVQPAAASTARQGGYNASLGSQPVASPSFRASSAAISLASR